MPVRLQAPSGRLRKNDRVAARTALKSAMWLAQENSSAAACGTAIFESRQRRVESAGEPQGSVEEYTLGVADVVEKLADGPFVGRVAVERLFLRDVGDDAESRVALRFEGGKHIITGNAVNVSVVIVRGFRGRGASGHGVTVALDRGREQPLLWWECRGSF